MSASSVRPTKGSDAKRPKQNELFAHRPQTASLPAWAENETNKKDDLIYSNYHADFLQLPHSFGLFLLALAAIFILFWAAKIGYTAAGTCATWMSRRFADWRGATTLQREADELVKQMEKMGERLVYDYGA